MFLAAELLPTSTLALRWIARVWGVAMVGLVLLFLVGETLAEGSGLPPLHVWPRLLLFPVGVCVGHLLGWKWEWLGGGLALACVAGFYLAEYASTGSFPRGYAFAVIAGPGAVFLAAAALGQWAQGVEHP